ncbi:MAG: VOC family protein, partial [Candidatus Marinimicrobia bacterium]|nr:VOC family protein [Candidatus Neomarinimicrobiota bacterium]
SCQKTALNISKYCHKLLFYQNKELIIKTNFDMIELLVPDLNKMVTFYRDMVGFKIASDFWE